MERNVKDILPSLPTVLYLYQSSRQFRLHVAVSWRETRRNSAISPQGRARQRKSNFPSYLRKKEEVCRLKSVLKNHAKSKAGIREGERRLETGIEAERKNVRTYFFKAKSWRFATTKRERERNWFESLDRIKNDVSALSKLLEFSVSFLICQMFHLRVSWYLHCTKRGGSARLIRKILLQEAKRVIQPQPARMSILLDGIPVLSYNIIIRSMECYFIVCKNTRF